MRLTHAGSFRLFASFAPSPRPRSLEAGPANSRSLPSALCLRRVSSPMIYHSAVSRTQPRMALLRGNFEREKAAIYSRALYSRSKTRCYCLQTPRTLSRGPALRLLSLNTGYSACSGSPSHARTRSGSPSNPDPPPSSTHHYEGRSPSHHSCYSSLPSVLTLLLRESAAPSPSINKRRSSGPLSLLSRSLPRHTLARHS